MIFISYRRDDSAFFAGRLVDRLMEWFDRRLIFLDVESIHAGEDFVDAITQTIKRSRVVLVVIGPNWLEVAAGERRIDDPQDVVRREIETALESQPNTHVVPVYLDKDCILTDASGLPESVRPLLNKNGALVRSGAEFHQDVRRLAAEMLRHLFPAVLSRTKHRVIHNLRRSRRMAAVIVIFGISILFGRDLVASQFLLTESGLASALARFDATAFQMIRPDANVQFARAFANRDALVADTDLAHAISETKRILSVYSIAATAFVTQHEALERALDRGAHVRFLLVDQSDDELQYLQPFLRSRDEIDITAAESKVKLALSISRISVLSGRASNSGKGKVELRTWKGVFWNSIWIRDFDDPENRLAHIEIGYVGHSRLNPSLRFGKTAPEMVSSVQEQFNLMWRQGTEIPLTR